MLGLGFCCITTSIGINIFSDTVWLSTLDMLRSHVLSSSFGLIVFEIGFRGVKLRNKNQSRFLSLTPFFCHSYVLAKLMQLFSVFADIQLT